MVASAWRRHRFHTCPVAVVQASCAAWVSCRSRSAGRSVWENGKPRRFRRLPPPRQGTGRLAVGGPPRHADRDGGVGQILNVEKIHPPPWTGPRAVMAGGADVRGGQLGHHPRGNRVIGRGPSRSPSSASSSAVAEVESAKGPCAARRRTAAAATSPHWPKGCGRVTPAGFAPARAPRRRRPPAHAARLERSEAGRGTQAPGQGGLLPRDPPLPTFVEVVAVIPTDDVGDDCSPPPRIGCGTRSRTRAPGATGAVQNRVNGA